MYTWNGVQTFQRPGFTLLWPRSLAAKSRPTFFYPLASSTFFAHPRSKFPFFPLDPPGADLIFTARLSLRTQHGIFGLPCLFAQCEYIWLVASGPAAVDTMREFFFWILSAKKTEKIVSPTKKNTELCRKSPCVQIWLHLLRTICASYIYLFWC